MRKHLSPNPETGKAIEVVEDESLAPNHCRIECAHSELDYARAMQQIEFGRGPITMDVRPAKGQSRKVLRFVVSPSDYDNVVAMMEDDTVTPLDDVEFASELMRATRGNN
jgi:hypothetical protein